MNIKVTKKQLTQIIKEELASILKEDYELYDEVGELYDTYDSLEALQADLEKAEGYGMNADDFEVKFPDGTRKWVYELREDTSAGNVMTDPDRLSKQVRRIPDSNFKSIDDPMELYAVLSDLFSRFDREKLSDQEIVLTLRKMLSAFSAKK